MSLEELLQHIAEPNWDWPNDDYAWLASRSGLRRTESDGGYTSIFFIHGGRIRQQAYLPYGGFSPDVFCKMITERAEGLDSPSVEWLADTGNDECGFWVEGTRLPTQDDVDRLNAAKVDEQDHCWKCGAHTSKPGAQAK